MADALALVSRLLDQVEEKEEFTELAGILREIEPVLEDAEKRRVKEEAVRVWLEKLKDVSCDIEDVLDECSTAVPNLQEEEEIHGMSKAKVLMKVCFSLLTSCFCCCQLVNRVGQRRRVAKKVKGLRERLSVIVSERHRFKFNYLKYREIDQLGHVGIGIGKDSCTLIEEPEIYGRDEDKNMLIGKLVCESSEGSRGSGVNSIVGVGGMGKTTLAQLVYNDQRVKTHFDVRIWVCESFSSTDTGIAREILEAISRKTKTFTNLVELEALLEGIRASIAGKKFLLVLDNAWDPRDADFSKGYLLWKLLHFGAAGSRILVTARTKNIARMMGATSMIDLSALSREDSWLMFSQRAFFGRDASDCRQLGKIGKKIVRMCYGLPLAIKTMGGLMHFKNTRGEWESVLREMMWELGHDKISTFNLLLFCYHDLSPALRCCFSYCAIFPKDHVIERDNLIKMWMSQGFLGFNVDRNKEKEILGQEYFMNLAMRSFFQDFQKDYKGSIIRCKMHELVHRLAKYVTRYECFITGFDCAEELDDEGAHDSTFVPAAGAEIGDPDIEGARHSTFVLAPGAEFPFSLRNGKGLRTLFTLSSIKFTINPDIFLHLTCLRTLNLSRCWFKELPEEVGKFLHLRYLNLSSNDELERLPETLCDLSNLQTLLINDCLRIRRLPEGMGKLVNLRHLHIDWSFNLESLPGGIAKLTSLQTLDMLVVPRSDEVEAFQLGDLKNLSNLEGYLHICRCGNLENVSEAEKAELINRGSLVDLNLDFDWSEDRRLEDKIILEALKPHPNLESLEIRKYRGTSMSPDWMMGLTNLRRLILYSCRNCESLPPLGKLPSLESLEICLMQSMKKVGCEFLGIESGGAEKSSFISFPKLRELRFYSLFEWNAWVGSATSMKETSTNIMPRLLSLEIDSCFCLKVLPHFLKMIPLQNLTISKCKILQKHCQKGKGKEWFKISHIPNIKIDF